eukprot:gnl/MRDRNA2_/MRDRNA2_31785_c0_seq1.p1 gnl/MRDRNA2_/MRDRNA2_31785_c0~~gnl/MRDRNA2_/MRDRNA2_31785_c0_seq1.p1  ORF type:complete len:321 (+),score=51.89 gnl/MRDRNA2_/MRDRNA2_31785_c0_seq1:122-1084(+)
MCSVIAIILHACSTQAYSDEPNSSDRYVNRLIGRAFQVQASNDSELDEMMLGKPGHLTMSPSRTIPVVPRAPLLSAKPGLLSAYNPGVIRMPRAMPAPRAMRGPHDAAHKELTWDEKRAPSGGGAYRDWPTAYQSLLDRGLKSIPPAQALRMMETKGAWLVDVRPADSTWEKLPLGPFKSATTITYMSGSAKGAYNVPLFRQIQGWSMFDIIKRMNAYMFLVEPTERNPEFSDLASNLPKDKPIIIACNRGGSLEHGLTKAKMNTPGRYSSSLKAAYELYRLGFNNLYVLDGGIQRWEKEGYPMDFDEEEFQAAPPIAPA